MTPADEVALREIVQGILSGGAWSERDCKPWVLKAFALGRASGWQAGRLGEALTLLDEASSRVKQATEAGIAEGLFDREDAEGDFDFITRIDEFKRLVTDDQRASVSGGYVMCETWGVPHLQGYAVNLRCLRRKGHDGEHRHEYDAESVAGERDVGAMQTADMVRLAMTPTDRKPGREATRETMMRDALACVVEWLTCCRMALPMLGVCKTHGSAEKHYLHMERTVEAALKGGGE